MSTRTFRSLLGMVLAAGIAFGGSGFAAAQAPGAPIVVTAQILDFERGYVFFTTGDGFHVAPNVTLLDYKTGRPAPPPVARDYARVTFSASGVVTKIETSATKVPAQGDLYSVHRFAIALSPTQPNPDLERPPTTLCGKTVAGKRVTVTFNIQVPPSTQLTDNVYMTTDQAAWNPTAYKLDRVDSLHYRATIGFYSGTVLHYLFDRGSSQSVQRGQNGLEQQPYLLCIGDADAQAVGKVVYHWGDEPASGNLPVPMTLPTPFNPAPFPNLPTPPTPAPIHSALPH